MANSGELSDDDVFGAATTSAPSPTQELTDAHVFADAPNEIGMQLQADKQAAEPAFMPKTARIDQGLGDPVYAMGQLASHLSVPGMDSPEVWDARAADRETVYQAARREAGQTGQDWLRLGGNLAATAPLALTPAGTTLGGMAASGAFTGGMSGLMTPVTDGGFWGEKGKQVGGGTVLGTVMGVLARGVTGMISPNPSKEVSLLQREGVTPTMGQLFGKNAATVEDAVQPFASFGQRRAVQQLNRAGYNRALKGVGEALKDDVKNGAQLPKFQFEGDLKDVGYDGIAQTGDKLSAAYEYILPKLQFNPAVDQQFGKDMRDIVLSTQTMTEPKAKQFNDILSVYLRPRFDKGVIGGDELKLLESQLGGQVAHFKGPNATPDDLLMSNALEDALTAVRDSVERTNPKDAAKLKAINNGWAILTRLERGVSGASEDGVITPAQLQNAVRAGDSSVRHRQFARGEALLQDLSDAGKKVLGNKYPNSGTPGRLAAMGIAGAATGAAGSGIVPAVNPGIGALMALQSMSYTPVGQRLVSGMASRRGGQVANLLSEGVRRTGPALQSGVARNLLSPEEPINLPGY